MLLFSINCQKKNARKINQFNNVECVARQNRFNNDVGNSIYF